MSQPLLLSNAFGRVLKVAGFKKKRAGTWYRGGEDVISVVNLQKSDHGRQYYVNVALWLRALGDSECPPESLCHIRCRLGDIAPDHVQRLSELLDLDDVSMSDHQRVAEVERVLEDDLLPFLSRASTLQELRHLVKSNSWLNSYVVARARAVLDAS